MSRMGDSIYEHWSVRVKEPRARTRPEPDGKVELALCSRNGRTVFEVAFLRGRSIYCTYILPNWIFIRIFMCTFSSNHLVAPLTFTEFNHNKATFLSLVVCCCTRSQELTKDSGQNSTDPTPGRWANQTDVCMCNGEPTSLSFYISFLAQHEPQLATDTHHVYWMFGVPQGSSLGPHTFWDETFLCSRFCSFSSLFVGTWWKKMMPIKGCT